MEYSARSRVISKLTIFPGRRKLSRGRYAAFAWAVYVAEVTVDLTSYSVTVDDFVCLQEVGRVLHPVLAAGQIIGGVAQGIGFALYEKVIWDKGRMKNWPDDNYIMPTSADIPPIRVFSRSWVMFTERTEQKESASYRWMDPRRHRQRHYRRARHFF